MSRLISVGRNDELPEGGTKVVTVDEHRVAVVRADGVPYAFEDVCPHMSAPLAEGQLCGKRLVCPWHGWTFDVSTGRCLTVPFVRLRTFEVKVESDELKLVID